MHLSEQNNVVKSTTAVYSEKYQLCKAVTGLATFSTLIVVYIILIGRAGTWKYLNQIQEFLYTCWGSLNSMDCFVNVGLPNIRQTINCRNLLQ